MNRATLTDILARIPSLKVGLLGDACVDVYWDADMRRSELSRETPQFPYPIIAERYSLGAGANVAANLAAAGCKQVEFVSFAGNDWRGTMLRRLFAEQGISDAHLVVSDEVVTPAYCKPILHGISDVAYEAPRLDFVNRTPASAALEDAVLAELEKVAAEVDVLVVSDQFHNGCVSERAIARLAEIGKRIPVLVDSRDRLNDYRGVTVKPNELETARALDLPPLDTRDLPAVFAAARALEQRNGAPSLVTLGGNGAVWCEAGECTHVPACKVQPPIDFVGAGDSFLAGFALASGLRLAPADRLAFACLLPAVTIRKLGMTGTASPDELLAAFDLYQNV